MKISRRSVMQWGGVLPLLPLGALAQAQGGDAGVSSSGPVTLPDKKNFAHMSMTWLDSGGTHPISLGARQALHEWIAARTLEVGAPPYAKETNGAARDRLRTRYAALINAKPEEICITQSTTAGENLIVQALNVPAAGGRIVTDTLHYPSSVYLYQSLQKAGMDVVWVRPRDGKSIDLDDLDHAIRKGTRLVAITLVSNVNGFQHELAKVCEIAHARGAYVYADLAQAAGSVPVDVRASNVDFASCAGYKWLMGDFGVGLLYVRQDVLPRLRRPLFGYQQVAKSVTHVYPLDPPGDSVADFQLRNDATGYFATGSTSAPVIEQLNYSLEYIRRIGVENIQRYRQPLLDHARAELEKRYPCMTPPGTTSPNLSFVYRDAARLQDRLAAARIKLTLDDNHFRVSPSVFNDANDIDKLVEVLLS